MAKNPVLPLYYNDLVCATKDWTDEEFGAYVRLLIEQWDKGFISPDMKRLQRISDSVNQNWPVLCKKFTPGEDGLLRNSIMEDIRIRRERFSQHQRENVLKRYKNSTKVSTKHITKKTPLEIEIEKEKEIELENEIVMPFTSENFRVLWQNWKKYRFQEFKRTYKSGQSEQAALANLARISNGIEEVAFKVIEQSIANQWQGLFELKNSDHGKNGSAKFAAKKVTGAELNEVFAKRYSQGR